MNCAGVVCSILCQPIAGASLCKYLELLDVLLHKRVLPLVQPAAVSLLAPHLQAHCCPHHGMRLALDEVQRQQPQQQATCRQRNAKQGSDISSSNRTNA
jgi:hypothetical protein